MVESKEIEKITAIIDEYISASKTPKHYLDLSAEDTLKELMIIKGVLTELQQIKSAELTKALECLEGLKNNIQEEIAWQWKGYARCKEETHKYDDDFNAIKQALIQKITWKHIHNTKVKVPLIQIFNGKTQEERHQIIEDIYYTWEEKKEKLEDKITSLENENKFLKVQKSNAERCWEIVVKKNVDILELRICIEHHNDKVALKLYNSKIRKDWQLNEEEFDKLKRGLGE